MSDNRPAEGCSAASATGQGVDHGRAADQPAAADPGADHPVSASPAPRDGDADNGEAPNRGARNGAADLIVQTSETPVDSPQHHPVQIVGAGPGAPDLLTLRAARALEQAEVLVWTDSLVNPQIAALAPEGCERIRTGNLTLEELLEVVISRARQGRRVVRLHDGDPCLYGALQEQICRLADAGLAVEVVPGLSAYQATAAALGQELTIPGLVQTIVLSRAGGRTGVPERESLQRLASLGASLCLYLSARHVEEVQEELLHHYPPETPVAIGYRVSWPDQWLSQVTLAEMAETSRARQLIRTTLYIVSPALGALGEARSRLYSPTHAHLFRSGAGQ